MRISDWSSDVCSSDLTNINEDFNKNTAAKSGWKINDFSKPIILVIKKNVTTLTALHKWLKELNAEGDGRISEVPMLLIDRQGVVSGKSLSVRVDLGGRSRLNKKKYSIASSQTET